MHLQAFRYVQETLHIQQIAVAGKDVLEIGSYIVNGTIRPLFADAKSYVGIDLRAGPGVDEVGDGATFGKPKSYDIVVCCEALEHYLEPDAVIENAAKLLRPGGYFIITVASDKRKPHGNDGNEVTEGEFYHGITSDLLEQWLGDEFGTDYAVLEDERAGDVYGWGKKSKVVAFM